MKKNCRQLREKRGEDEQLLSCMGTHGALGFNVMMMMSTFEHA